MLFLVSPPNLRKLDCPRKTGIHFFSPPSMVKLLSGPAVGQHTDGYFIAAQVSFGVQIIQLDSHCGASAFDSDSPNHLPPAARQILNELPGRAARSRAARHRPF